MRTDLRSQRTVWLTATLLAAAAILVLLLFASLPGSATTAQGASSPSSAGVAQQQPAATPPPTPPALSAAFYMPLVRYPAGDEPVACAQWSLEHDLRVVSHSNPAPDSCGNSNVWHLLAGPESRMPSSYTLLSLFENDVQGLGLQGWRQVTGTAPYLFFNAGGDEKLLDGVVPVAGLTVVAHPGVTQVVAAAWRSPINGRVSITGSVTDIDPRGAAGMRWFVDSATATLASGQTPANGRQLLRSGTGGAALAEQSVAAGDFVYLVLQGNDAAVGENTRLDFRITLLPDQVQIDGPAEIAQGTSARYTATVAPGQIIPPINWLWRATDQAPQGRTTNGVIDSTQYTWTVAGRKVISVTATTAEGEISGSKVVTVTGAPAIVVVSGVSTGGLGSVLQYTATVSPAFTAVPLTYTWEATGQPVVTHTVPTRTDSNTYTWTELGEQTITVTVRNGLGDAQGTYGVFIEKRLYSPIVRNTLQTSGR